MDILRKSLGMIEYRRVGYSTMNGLCWWLGWRPKIGFIFGAALGIGFYVPTNSTFLGLFGLALPVALWIWSTKSINEQWAEIFASVSRRVDIQGRQRLNLEGDFKSFLVTSESGDATLVTPKKTYRFKCVYVTPVLVAIYQGAEYDATTGRLKSGTETKEIYLKQIAGVDYRPPVIEMKSVAGGALLVVQPESEEVAHAIIGQIRSGLRAVHAA